jgi:hypothetical protein
MTSMVTPQCYFVDYNATGEFVLLSDVVSWGGESCTVGGPDAKQNSQRQNGKGEDGDGDAILPFKHRIRDCVSVPEQRLFIRAGAGLNAQFWGCAEDGEPNPDLTGLPRFELTHRCVQITCAQAKFDVLALQFLVL